MTELTESQRALVEKGSASLHSLTNAAYGTPGWDVLELVRKGVWREISREPDNHGYYISAYGPRP